MKMSESSKNGYIIIIIIVHLYFVTHSSLLFGSNERRVKEDVTGLEFSDTLSFISDEVSFSFFCLFIAPTERDAHVVI